MVELINFDVDEKSTETLDALVKLLESEHKKYSEFLKGGFAKIINDREVVFEYDGGLIDVVSKSMINLRRETFNNPRVLKLRDVDGVDITEKLYEMLSVTFGEFLYPKLEEESENIEEINE